MRKHRRLEHKLADDEALACPLVPEHQRQEAQLVRRQKEIKFFGQNLGHLSYAQSVVPIRDSTRLGRRQQHGVQLQPHVLRNVVGGLHELVLNSSAVHGLQVARHLVQKNCKFNETHRLRMSHGTRLIYIYFYRSIGALLDLVVAVAVLHIGFRRGVLALEQAAVDAYAVRVGGVRSSRRR